MSAFNFPASAVANQEYAAPNGTVYVFDGQKWNVKSASLAGVATSGDFNDLVNKPEEYSFSIGGDDSTLREIRNNESITIKGGNNISTTVDVEGNVTISGEDGIVPGNTYDINISGDVVATDSTVLVNTTTNTLQGTLDGDVNGSVFADDTTLLVDGVAGNIPAEVIDGTANIDVVGNLTGDVTGNVLGDGSNVIVDATSSTIYASDIHAESQNVYFGSPEVARIRVYEEVRQTGDAFDVFLFTASDYRSMKIIIQATNLTDDEYYVSELLCFHDGTNAYTTEYATMHTTSTPDISAVAILNNGNFILRITPALNVNIHYKFIIQTMTA